MLRKVFFKNSILCLSAITIFLIPTRNATAFEIINLGDPSAYTLPDGTLILSGTNRKQQRINAPVFVGSNLKELDSSPVNDALPLLPLWSSDSVWE